MEGLKKSGLIGQLSMACPGSAHTDLLVKERSRDVKIPGSVSLDRYSIGPRTQDEVINSVRSDTGVDSGKQLSTFVTGSAEAFDL